ncbi:EAL domain-containing protein [Pseudoduganella chitinolytica]|uniref:EAL domain-containing protein n=1 Tax=Pseudoduganella chitinolytica TaxID=34070 RepID=A0ABY8BHQ3_9BURK|nr:EAL domain-containing protein [Pseudoduganella chitinolytica]WEF35457.1 EAL domain-containing protein [Pseudoduganella chitinolytica]
MPNRFAAQRHLNRILLEAHGNGKELAVMYLDLDRFKAVNDTLGHAAGDALLVSVAARLRNCFRAVDMISRQGGDEFVVLMAPGTSSDDATRAADRILAAVAQPHTIEAEQVHVGCSIGIALYPQHGRSAETLLRHADTALHSAKVSGRNAWRFFRPELLASAVQRRQVEDGIRTGLEHGSFQLFYQPKFRLSDGTLGGCEALLRWHHADWGWVSPARFIRAAEESGLIVPLGKWVLDEAIRQAGVWERAGCCPEAIAINVSALVLKDPTFPDRIARKIGEAGLDPRRLQVELTESALMRDMHASALALQRLKDVGLSIAIDDFGTGYSSLGYLAELPIDLVKVDRAFVHGIDTATPRRQALLRAVSRWPTTSRCRRWRKASRRSRRCSSWPMRAARWARAITLAGRSTPPVSPAHSSTHRFPSRRRPDGPRHRPRSGTRRRRRRCGSFSTRITVAVSRA